MKRTVYISLLALTLLFAVLMVGCFVANRDEEFPLTFSIKTSSGTQQIGLYCAEDGGYHVFLPAYCQPQMVTVQLSDEVYIDGKRLADGSSLAWVDLEKQYEMELNGTVSSLQFWQADNVATMYINTRSGSMDYIHADKNHEEYASMELYAQDGVLDCSDVLCSVKGRGNATWLCRKKPYVLSLSADADLMGMGASSKWVLLANAMDESNLHNKIAMDLSERVGMEWTPESTYVELYLNGSYNGLYLLTEKIEVQESRLKLDFTAGDFLGCIEPKARRQILDHPILTSQNRLVNLCAPAYPTGEEQMRIEQRVDRLEELIFSAESTQWPEEMNLDSWVRRYLIDEICANIDADLASSYFYYTDGTFYAGPVWDYDMSFGNQISNQNPHSFTAKNFRRSQYYETPYDTALLENEVFYARMTELYETVFLPVVEKLVSTDIRALADEIAAATKMNSLRWQTMFTLNPVTTTTAEGMTEYLRERIAFLSRAWIDGIDYCTVQMEVSPGGACWGISVERGTVLDRDFIDVDEDFEDQNLEALASEDLVWTVLETGDVFDLDMPVTEDLFLVQAPAKEVVSEQTSVQDTPVSPEIKVAFVIIAAFGAMAICLMIADLRRCRQGRRKSHE